jgi:hypothetical protein
MFPRIVFSKFTQILSIHPSNVRCMRHLIAFVILGSLLTGCAEKCEVCITRDSANNQIASQEFCGKVKEVDDAVDTYRTNQRNTYGTGATVTCTKK